MKVNRHYSVLLASLCILALGSGCARTRQTRNVETTGFLGDYSMLKEGEGKEAQLVYVKPGLNLAKYKKVYIAPITIMKTEGSDVADLDPEDMQRLADYLYMALYGQLSQDYTIVSTPGADVLKLRAAITEARGTKVILNSVTTSVPQVRTVSYFSGWATNTSVFVGKAGIEGEISDSRSGERLMAAVDERVGGKTLRGLGKWSDVEAAFDLWAKRLRERLQELGGPKPAESK